MCSLRQEVQNQIPYVSIEITFSKVLPVCRNDAINISKFNFFATVCSVYAQFTSVNRRLNSSYFKLKQHFESTSRMRKCRH